MSKTGDTIDVIIEGAEQSCSTLEIRIPLDPPEAPLPTDREENLAILLGHSDI